MLIRLIRFALIIGAGIAASLLGAQAAPPSGELSPVRSFQQQIDELRENQRRMQKDLEDIKALLTERTGRAEVPSKRQPPSEITMNVYGEPFRGAAQARVAILEYSDFDCSFCARYATQIYPRIEDEYIKTGKIKYFFHDLPILKEHPNALYKARIARCAGDQGKFWEMHDRLFADQRPVDDQVLPRLIHSLGMDSELFNACLTSDKYTENIMRSIALAERTGVTGTPAFLIGTVSEDGRLLKATKIFFGAESFEAFKRILDEFLLAPQPDPAHPSTCS